MSASTTAALLGLLCIACGAKSALDENASAPGVDASPGSDLGHPDSGSADLGSDSGPGRDLGFPDLGPPREPCVASCEFCTPRGPTVVLSEDWGQTPDPEWDGEKLLVAYDLRSRDLVALSAVDLDGTILWNEPIRGVQHPRVAFDREAGAGLVIFDRGLQWLGADGRPVGMPQQLDVPGLVSGDVAVTPDGFLAMFASSAGPLRFDRVGTTEERVRTTVFGPTDTDGWGPPEHVTDEAGHVRFIATSTHDWSRAELYRADGPGAPEWIADLGSRGQIHGITRGLGDELYLVRDESPEAIALERLDGSGALIGRTSIPSARRTLTGQVLRVGESLIVTAVGLGDGSGTLACADIRDPGGYTTTTYYPDRVSTGSRMARLPRGFALAWGAVSGRAFVRPMLQIYDCCVPD